jgi:hypothetical protein
MILFLFFDRLFRKSVPPPPPPTEEEEGGPTAEIKIAMDGLEDQKKKLTDLQRKLREQDPQKCPSGSGSCPQPA